MSRQDLLQRIVSEPGVCGGRPCIRGTRIDVTVVLSSLSQGLTPQQIVKEYPALTLDDVNAALAYASELANESVWRLAAG
jgi:uncharacterized protein (DUF433 family)